MGRRRFQNVEKCRQQILCGSSLFTSIPKRRYNYADRDLRVHEEKSSVWKGITMKAIRINEIGGPEVMQLEEVETPTPQEGEVLIKVAAAGVTQADLAQRQGTYLIRT